LKTFVVLPVANAAYRTVVIATSWENPWDDLPALEQALTGLVGPILVDSLCAVGPASNRFLTAHFDGQRLVPHTVRQVTRLDSATASAVAAYYRAHPDPFAASVLSRYDQIRLRHMPLAPLEADGSIGKEALS